MPNAGKSTFIRAISSAKPKVADYPFTTMYPNLGVVRVGFQSSFVVADIPGLIEGAAQGAGLGVRFLKHLARTHILLHIVDIAPIDGSNPIDNIKTINQELANFSEDLAAKPQWLLLNKCDVLSDEAINQKEQEIINTLHWQQPVFCISAVDKTNLNELCQALMRYIENDAN
mgnify:CR=1 FL=1